MARHKLRASSSPESLEKGEKTYPVMDDTAPTLCAVNVKWPRNPETEEHESLCKVPVCKRSNRPLSRSANASTRCYGSARNCDPIKHDPRIARPSSVCGSCEKTATGSRLHCSKSKSTT
ncbi:hypothetical protein R1flu_009073 [Riccia fluitans]|uniref:Uncharacterized protein n=1 Tax=Riccia fluitans TaxID=41844 RepID=A0ABD1Z114_9MARC